MPTSSLTYAQIGSPIGPLAIISSEKGLKHILHGDEAECVATYIERYHPNRPYTRNDAQLAPIREALLSYLNAGIPLPTIALDIEGTNFQKRCWQQLQAIPHGQTIPYQALAEKAGSPKGARAAGTACGSNPVPLFVPCHRVIASDGTLGGFAWGLKTKERLLQLEAAFHRFERAA